MAKATVSSVSSELMFVTISHPDDIRKRKGVRTDIRRHVMKDIGQERRRPKKQAAGRKASSNSSPASTSQADRHVAPSARTTDVSPELPTPSAKLPVLWDFPVAPNGRVVELIRLLNEQRAVYLPFRSIWFDIALTDKGAFHVTLGNAADLLLRLRGGSDPLKNPEMLQYYSLSVAHLRDRLNCDAERVSDGIVAHILSHLCLCMRREDWTAWKAHIDGLAAIWRARSGLAHLSRGTQTYMLLADLGGSLVHDTVPRLALPSHLPPPCKTPMNEMPTCLRDLLSRSHVSSSAMAQTNQALERVFLVAKEVNTKGTSPLFWQRDEDGLHLLGSCIHFLLSMPRLSEISAVIHEIDELVMEMVRLVSLCLMSRLKTMFTFTTPEQAQLEMKLTGFMVCYANDIGGYYRDLKVWALVTAALLHNGASRAVYLNELRQEMAATCEMDAEACIQAAKEFIWFDALGNAYTDQLIRDIALYQNGQTG